MTLKSAHSSSPIIFDAYFEGDRTVAKVLKYLRKGKTVSVTGELTFREVNGKTYYTLNDARLNFIPSPTAKPSDDRPEPPEQPAAERRKPTVVLDQSEEKPRWEEDDDDAPTGLKIRTKRSPSNKLFKKTIFCFIMYQDLKRWGGKPLSRCVSFDELHDVVSTSYRNVAQPRRLRGLMRTLADRYKVDPLEIENIGIGSLRHICRLREPAIAKDDPLVLSFYELKYRLGLAVRECARQLGVHENDLSTKCLMRII